MTDQISGLVHLYIQLSVFSKFNWSVQMQISLKLNSHKSNIFQTNPEFSEHTFEI